MPREVRHGGDAGTARTVLGDLGAVLHLPALMTVPTLLVAVVAGERFAILPLVAAGLLTLIAGQLLYRHFGGQRQQTGVRTALAVVAVAWVVIGLVAASVLWGTALLAGPGSGSAEVYADPVDALFEGMSAATATGLTVADGLEARLPATLQWWRSLLQWVGAVGVIIFTLAVTSTGAKGPLLLEAATRPEMLGDDVRVTARRIWGLFAGMTVVAVLALLLAGLSAWEALNHGLTAIATGGFTITDDSFAAHGTTGQLLGVVLIAAGAVSFVAHYQLFIRRETHAFLRGTQQRALALGLGLGIPVLAAVHLAEAGGSDVLAVVFQWTSALATAGFSTVDLATWGPGALLLLVAAMLVGGSSGSTAGGIKLSRVSWLAKALVTRLRAAEPGQRESLHYWDGQQVSAEQSRKAEAHAGGFVLLWMSTLLAGVITVSVLEPTARTMHVLFDVTSSLSNVGLDAGVVGGDLGSTTKIVFTVLMLVGRLEILGLVVLLRAPFVPDGPEQRDASTAAPADADHEATPVEDDAEENPEAEEDVGPEHPPPGA